MIEKMPNRLNPLYKDGIWHQDKHLPDIYDEDSVLSYEPFTIKRKNGQWFVAMGDGSDADWISVREDIAKIIVVGIEAERRMRERKADREEAAAVPFELDEEGNEEYTIDGTLYQENLKKVQLPQKYTQFYCHAVLQYLLKLPGRSHEADALYRSIEGYSFQYADSYGDFVQSIQNIHFPIIGRIAKLDGLSPEQLSMVTDVHSFLILGRDAQGNFLCFEKAESYEYPVRLNTLEHIYQFHNEDAFAFQSFDNVVKQVQERRMQSDVL